MSTISKALPTPPDNFSTQIATASVGTTTLSIQLDDATNLGTEGVGQLFKKDANGDIIAGSVEFIHWTGKAANTITLTDTGDRGLTGSDAGAQSYVADDYFEVWVSSYYDFRNAFDEEHNADGTHVATIVKTTASQTLTNKTLTSPILTTPTIDTIASTRVNPRTNTTASSATPAINTDTTDIFTITALATAITSMTSSLSGTPVNGQKLIIRIKDDGTARAITWGASFASRGATLPTTTTLGKYSYVGLIYNSTASIWDCVSVVTEA